MPITMSRINIQNDTKPLQRKRTFPATDLEHRTIALDTSLCRAASWFRAIYLCSYLARRVSFHLCIYTNVYLSICRDEIYLVLQLVNTLIFNIIHLPLHSSIHSSFIHPSIQSTVLKPSIHPSFLNPTFIHPSFIQRFFFHSSFIHLFLIHPFVIHPFNLIVHTSIMHLISIFHKPSLCSAVTSLFPYIHIFSLYLFVCTFFFCLFIPSPIIYLFD